MAILSAPISASFNSLPFFSWLTSAYSVANVASQALSVKITDIYGREASLVFCFVAIAAGNLICALVGADWVMVIGKVVAGIGGGRLSTIINVCRLGFGSFSGDVVYGKQPPTSCSDCGRA